MLFNTLLNMKDGFVPYIPYIALGLFIIGAAVYLVANRKKIKPSVN